MFKQLVAAGSAAIFTSIASMTAAQAEPLNQWTGAWVKNAGGLHSLSISNTGGSLTVNVKGECTPNPCDWGSVPGVAYSNSAGTDPATNTEAITAVFNQGFSTKTVVLNGRAGNNLRAHVYTRFTDGSGRDDYVLHASMKRPVITAIPLPDRPVLINPDRPVIGGTILAQPVKTFTDDCININPAQVSVARKNGRWKLVQGNMWILDADQKRNEMLRARQIVQNYGLNKQCFVGRPDASLKYWLTDNNAPSGAMANEDCININPNALTIRDAGGRSTILSNGNHAAFSAPSAAEAQTVIDVIKYYGFTKSCYVGRPDPSMAYLRK